MSFSRRVRSMAVLIGEASEVARGREGQKWVGRMVWEHHVSMTPRTEVSVCERETIGERKKKLLGSEIVTEREVGQFFWKKWETAHGLCGVGECFCMAWFREVRAQVVERMTRK